MRYRNHKGVKVSEIGVGCYSLSGVYGRKDREEFRRVIERAVEEGVNFFDTADIYGDAERFLGEVLRPYRSEVMIATKFGMTYSIKPNLTPEYIKEACERSLQIWEPFRKVSLPQ